MSGDLPVNEWMIGLSPLLRKKTNRAGNHLNSNLNGNENI